MTEQRDVFLGGEGNAWFDRNSTGELAVSTLDTRLVAHVQAGSSVLEVGCADGRKLAVLAQLVPGRFVGLDPSAEAILEGQTRWPTLDLCVGSADSLPFEEQFDVVILGFFLYLCDRSLLPRVIAEADRVLADGGTLAVIDFDPPYPTRRPYRHCEGLWSFKLDYASLFLAFPSYALAEKIPFHHGGDGWSKDGTERIAMSILKKDLSAGYSHEDDLGH